MNVTHKGPIPCQFDLLVQNLQQQKEIINNLHLQKKLIYFDSLVKFLTTWLVMITWESAWYFLQIYLNYTGNSCTYKLVNFRRLLNEFVEDSIINKPIGNVFLYIRQVEKKG